MESHRARRLTTILVAVGLALGLVCFLVGAGLALSAETPRDARTLSATDIGAALAGHDPLAWLSLGVLFLVLTPSLRLIGMLLTFRAERRPLAMLTGAVVLLVLLASLTRAVLAERPAVPDSEEERPR